MLTLTEVVGTAVTVEDGGGVNTATAMCPAGQRAVSGGFTASSSLIFPVESRRPVGFTDRWTVTFRNTSSNVDGTAQAIVYCSP
ncbi:hypothetical protein ACIQUQ_13980 [Streptomyces sp. NPDC101118]|uniref:hypothetical protein n=1 Tax=Streptomyces sp. NPDC101118 TaxID=3366109 RepID=UPI003818D7E9